MSLWTRKTRRRRAAEPETTIRSRIAIFGGTFDPVHNAHLTVAREAVLQYGLSTVLFVVASNPPHKTGSTQASYEQRYRMVELACQRAPEFTPSRIEEDEAISYSIHTIDRVKAVAGPEALVYFLIGADAFSEIETWHRWSDVVRQVAFIVVTRPGHHYRTPPGATVYDFDGEAATSAAVAAVHAKGLIAICYIDVGVFETYRKDAGNFPGSSKFTDPNTGQPIVYTGDPQYANRNVIGSADAGWDGSYWLDIRQLEIIEPIMLARFQMCKAKGFDAIEPDEQNGYANASGFPLSDQDQLTYNTWIANTVHTLGLSVGLKSDQAQAKDLVNLYDWDLTESCYQYNECNQLAPFTQAHKASWIVEYAASPNCADANPNHYNAMRRDLNLVGPTKAAYLFQPCLSPGATTWP